MSYKHLVLDGRIVVQLYSLLKKFFFSGPDWNQPMTFNHYHAIQAKMPQIPSLIPRPFFATPRKKLWHRRRPHFVTLVKFAVCKYLHWLSSMQLCMFWTHRVESNVVQSTLAYYISILFRVLIFLSHTGLLQHSPSPLFQHQIKAGCFFLEILSWGRDLIVNLMN